MQWNGCGIAVECEARAHGIEEESQMILRELEHASVMFLKKMGFFVIFVLFAQPDH